VFSELTEDPSITVPIDRIDLQKFYEEAENGELYLDEFKDSCLVFDDFDCIQNKVRKKLFNLLYYLLFTGRHIGATLLITLHNPVSKSG
jgi:hypothetical protein